VGRYHNVVILTGAGAVGRERAWHISRGPWENFRIEDMATPEAFARDPDRVHDFYNLRRSWHKAARPNAAHLALARLKLLRLEGAAEEVAGGSAERLQFRRPPRRPGDRRDRRLVLFVSIDFGVLRQRQGESAEAGEKIGDPLGALRAVPGQGYEYSLRLTRGLQKGARRQGDTRA
jgi:hypothetical protein